MIILELTGQSIEEQLALERRLLKEDNRSFCLINRGTPRTIVMGVSGKAEELLHLDRVERDNVSLLRRFSGGGTVIVDEGTLFISFIMAKEAVDCQLFPEPIMRWTADLYAKSWKIPGFQLRENDYVVGDRKCGGNAQYIQKARWLHHTSFLWDYSEKNMDYLLLPQKRPNYRADRPHSEFLCRLKEHVADQEFLIAALKEELGRRFLTTSRSVASL